MSCCNTGCCTPNIPVRTSSHADCHCTGTNLCESPVIQKRVSSCNDGCCTSSTTSIINGKDVLQYVNNLAAEHCGHSTHSVDTIMDDLTCGATRNSSTCTPLKYKELNCQTVSNTNCCSSGIDSIKLLAGRVRGNLNGKCHTYGDIKPMIKEIPNAGIYIVNYVFVDLIIDNILGCLPKQNMNQTAVSLVEFYTEQYYTYYEDIEEVGALVLGTTISLDTDLIADPIKVNRIKTVLYALSERLNGRIKDNEQ